MNQQYTTDVIFMGTNNQGVVNELNFHFATFDHSSWLELYLAILCEAQGEFVRRAVDYTVTNVVISLPGANANLTFHTYDLFMRRTPTPMLFVFVRQYEPLQAAPLRQWPVDRTAPAA